MDTWTIYASSGEYDVEGENAAHAYLRFTETHHDDFVLAIVNTEMNPALVLADEVTVLEEFDGKSITLTTAEESEVE